MFPQVQESILYQPTQSETAIKVSIGQETCNLESSMLFHVSLGTLLRLNRKLNTKAESLN